MFRSTHQSIVRTRTIVTSILGALLVAGAFILVGGTATAENGGCIVTETDPIIWSCLASCDLQTDQCNAQAATQWQTCTAACGSSQQCSENCIDAWVAERDSCEQQHIGCVSNCGTSCSE